MSRLSDAGARARRAGWTTLIFSPAVGSVARESIACAMRVEEAVARLKRVCAVLEIDAEPIIKACGGDPFALKEEYRRLADGTKKRGST